MKRPFLYALMFLAATQARADFLELRRNANIYEQADNDSQQVGRLEFDANSDLFIDLADLQLVNGYYHVRVPGSPLTGFLYRTLVRRFPGDRPDQPAPTAPTSPTPSAGEDTDDPPDGPATAALTIAGSWGTTKEWARDIIYAGRSAELYCGCPFTRTGTSGGTIDTAACGYDGSNVTHSARATVLEWEHVVPASLMPARQFACWTTGLPQCSAAGRACCEQHDLDARAMIFDLHNLAPSVGQANALRDNKRYGLIDGEDRRLGTCDFEWTSTLTEPATGIRGDVARIWMYFNSRHGLQLQQGELEMFTQWSNGDPPDQAEFERNERVKAQQGNGNPFVEMFSQ